MAYYYNQLSKIEQKAYYAIKEGLKNLAPSFTVPLLDAKTLSDIYVNFILKKDNDGIKIIDLKLGESSLILSYRSRFYEMIAQNDDDIDWFLTDLGDITEAAERTIQENLRQTEY